MTTSTLVTDGWAVYLVQQPGGIANPHCTKCNNSPLKVSHPSIALFVNTIIKPVYVCKTLVKYCRYLSNVVNCNSCCTAKQYEQKL